MVTVRPAFVLLIFALTLFTQSALAQNSEQNPTRTVERLQTPFIARNQGNTSTCWLHSALQMMEQTARRALSVDALLIPEIRSRALDRFLGYETPWDGGAGPTRPFALALEHGLIPDDVWKSRQPIVQNYAKIFSEIEKLLQEHNNTLGTAVSPRAKQKFLKSVDNIIMKFTGSLPPESFTLKQAGQSEQEITTTDYARQIIGHGDSRGYDFRNVPYLDHLYGRMPEVAWTTIIGKDGELKKITDIIPKRTERVTALQAFEYAAQIFSAGRPVAFTFIYFNEKGERVLGLNRTTKEYTVEIPAVATGYTGSHLVLIAGIIRELNPVTGENEIVGFEILDPLAASRPGEDGIRIVTKEFFMTHGKTVHEIAPPTSFSQEFDCSRFLSAQYAGY